MSIQYRPDIDGLRTIAVVPVVVFHAGLGLDGGFVGVDVFFVISGYLITSLLLKDLDAGSYSIIDFYERRARRILPALFAMLAIATLVAFVLFIPEDLDDYGKSAAAASAFLANVWFYTQEGYFNEAAELKPLLHTWSLGVEEQYYIVFPILLWLLYRRLGSAGLQAVLAILAAISLALSMRATTNDPNAAFYLPQNRIWELFVGSLLAVATVRNWLAPLSARRGVVSAAAVVGLLAILASVVLYGPETRFPGVAALLPCLGAAVIIATGGLAATPVSRMLSTRPFVAIGKVSYSFYLWHWPVISFTYYAGGEDLTAVQGFVCVAISLALAFSSYALVERPFRDRTRFSRGAIFAASVAGLAAFVLIGGTFAKTNGLPGRMPDEIIALIDSDTLVHDRRDCHFVTAERARNGDVCILGDTTAEPSFALVGDSHADAFSPALFRAAEADGVAGYQFTNAGFCPLVGVSKRGSPGLREDTEALIAFLSERPEIRTIFLTGYWAHYVSGYSYRHHGDVWLDDGYDNTGSAYNATAIANGLRRLAERLPGVRIVLLDDVPGGTALHLKSKLRSFRFGNLDLTGMDGDEADAARRIYEPLLETLAAEVDGIEYHRFFTVLCGETTCPLFDGDTLLFRDGDHLSFQGAMTLVDEAGALLRATLRP